VTATIASVATPERTLVEIKPHPLSILLRRALLLLTFLVVLIVAGPFASALGYALPFWIRLLIGALIALLIAWDTLVWISRSYRLTDRRVERRAGVLRRYVAELPLRNVQHVILYRSIRERVFGLGTLGFATAGTGATEVFWVMIAKPEQRLAEVRQALEASR
jgi:uncharacterized membrane protein YdbT with pleckstrin-like domain